MHWADAFASKLSGEQVVSTGISPSGPIHIGSMREILTGDIIHRAIRDRGLPSRFIYLCDDMDPLRRRYSFLDPAYEKHVGMPLYTIPSPEGNGNYSDYYLAPFLDVLEKLEVNVEVIKTHSLYAKGKLAEATRIAIEKRHLIRKILEEVTGRELPDDWFPYNPICASCGRVDTTTATAFDYPFVEYECRCGYRGKADIRKDHGKMPWRVEWPAKWFALGVTVESYGKDHAAAGSSYDTGKRIIREIFNGRAPDGIVYEHIYLKGKGAMHSSTGNLISAAEMISFSPPEILRFIIAKNNPSRHIVFDPGSGLLNLIDEFDRYRLSYFGNGSVKDEDFKRVYEFSRIRRYESSIDVGFRHLVTLIQMYPNEDELIRAINRSGHRTESSDAALRVRIESARKWLEKYAPDSIKFRILDTEEVVSLPEGSRPIIEKFLKSIEDIEWSAESIHNTVYQIIKESGMNARTGFSFFYRLLTGGDRGPRLGYFMSNLDREWIKERFAFCLKKC